MAFPLVAGDVIEYKQCSWFQNQLGINVLHYQLRTPAGGILLSNAMLDSMNLAMATAVRPLLTNGAQFVGSFLKKILPLPVSTIEQSIIGAGFGSAGTDALPLEITGMITKRSAFPGRQFRGRVYIPFPDETDNDNGTPGMGYTGRLQAWANVNLAPITITTLGGVSVTIDPVIFQRAGTFGGVFRPAGVVFINGFTVRTKWAQQHRRGAYGKMNANPFA